MESTDKGWYDRGYLPHFDSSAAIQPVTFRLADSLPREIEKQLDCKRKALPDQAQDAERRDRIEGWLDAGHGSCVLADPKVGALGQRAMLHHAGGKYELHAWCVMPNHVHVLIKPHTSLGNIVKSWKSYTGRWVLGRWDELSIDDKHDNVPKQLWQREYWDRYIRDEAHYRAVVEYIHGNPVKAGLCKTEMEWPWSSAARGCKT